MAARPSFAQPRGLLASPGRNLIVGLLYMAVVMAAAVVSYVAAGWSFGDAFYMVILTVYTVGFEEVQRVDTTLLRTITISTIVFGCTGVIFLTGALVQFITLNQINQVFGIKRMTTQIDKLSDHVIICGFGRIGVMLAETLEAAGAPFVIVERDEERVERARDLGYLCIQADAADESALQTAGVIRARVVATVLPNDAANVFITLSARNLHPEVEIIARGEAPSTERMLLQAGANRVVQPTHIGAERIAEIILYEKTASFIHGSDQARDFERVLQKLGLSVEVVTAAPGSPAVGETIEAIERAADGAFFIVQTIHRDGEATTQPEPGMRIRDGDGLVLIGRTPGSTSLFEAGGRSGIRRSAR